MRGGRVVNIQKRRRRATRKIARLRWDQTIRKWKKLLDGAKLVNRGRGLLVEFAEPPPKGLVMTTSYSADGHIRMTVEGRVTSVVNEAEVGVYE